MNKKTIISIVAIVIILGIVTVVALPNKKSSDIEIGNKQSLTWVPNTITSSEVAVNIIKKVNDNPNTYELVRTVSTKTLNDGSATWVPAKSDINNNLFVEIGCVETVNACQASIISSNLAVIDSNKYQNSASAFQAIENLDNN